MGRHNKSNGRAIDVTYDYDRFAPSHAGPRPCYGRSNGPKMSVAAFREMIRKDPNAFPCGTVQHRYEDAEKFHGAAS